MKNFIKTTFAVAIIALTFASCAKAPEVEMTSAKAAIEAAKAVESLEDFNKEEVEIACKLGTTAVAAAKKYIPKAKLRDRKSVV